MAAETKATILHCLGMDHNRFTFRFQGLNHKPTGVEPAKGILAWRNCRFVFPRIGLRGCCGASRLVLG